MLNRSILHGIGKWLAVAAMLGAGLAMAQSEPTLNQVYEAAQAGRLDQAQTMVQQVLVAHPNSAKAYFVQAELSARQGRMDRAREALGTAERLAPALPFAKPEAVQALRAQLASASTRPVANSQTARSANAGVPATTSAPFPWGMALALGAGVIVIALFLRRPKPVPAPMAPVADPNQAAMQTGLAGPQSFGMGGGATAPAYGQPAGSGLGGKLMGGLATGLAVGAGVMAAQAIGKSLMGNDEHSAHQNDGAAGNAYQPIAGNDDLGGQNFGVRDAGSWDDGDAVASSGDGGDWDS